MIPEPKVRKVLPACRICESPDDVIVGDGPVVCRPCIKEAAILAKSVTKRSDSPDMRQRGWWQS